MITKSYTVSFWGADIHPFGKTVTSKVTLLDDGGVHVRAIRDVWEYANEYASIIQFLNVCDILDRRVLVEKTGFCI